MDTSLFEELLLQHKSVVERMVYYKTPIKADGEDVLQEVYLSAYRQFSSLKNTDSFKSWILKIAANKCNDFYRKRVKLSECQLSEPISDMLIDEQFNGYDYNPVQETLDELNDTQKQILYLYYFDSKSQTEIAKQLNIPLGTVKSRLFNARHHFKLFYPCPPAMKGENVMMKLPDRIPEYKISKVGQEPFEVRWEELSGWMIVPRLGEKLQWAIYDFPERTKKESYEIEVIGKAMVHGIEGVEIVAKETFTDGSPGTNHTFIAQLTDTHCRYLAESHYEGDIKRFNTFLDGDEFLPSWGIGEDNCGNEIWVRSKGLIKQEGTMIECPQDVVVLDVTGRYRIAINNKIYDTLCIMNIEIDNGVMSQAYVDKNGRTILWRRFNRDDWGIDRYKARWSEKLVGNETLTVNGDLYIHWYDCITDYVL